MISRHTHQYHFNCSYPGFGNNDILFLRSRQYAFEHPYHFARIPERFAVIFDHWRKTSINTWFFGISWFLFAKYIIFKEIPDSE